MYPAVIPAIRRTPTSVGGAGTGISKYRQAPPMSNARTALIAVFMDTVYDAAASEPFRGTCFSLFRRAQLARGVWPSMACEVGQPSGQTSSVCGGLQPALEQASRGRWGVTSASRPKGTLRRCRRKVGASSARLDKLKHVPRKRPNSPQTDEACSPGWPRCGSCPNPKC